MCSAQIPAAYGTGTEMRTGGSRVLGTPPDARTWDRKSNPTWTGEHARRFDRIGPQPDVHGGSPVCSAIPSGFDLSRGGRSQRGRREPGPGLRLSFSTPLQKMSVTHRWVQRCRGGWGGVQVGGRQRCSLPERRGARTSAQTRAAQRPVQGGPPAGREPRLGCADFTGASPGSRERDGSPDTAPRTGSAGADQAAPCRRCEEAEGAVVCKKAGANLRLSFHKK